MEEDVVIDDRAVAAGDGGWESAGSDDSEAVDPPEGERTREGGEGRPEGG